MEVEKKYNEPIVTFMGWDMKTPTANVKLRPRSAVDQVAVDLWSL